MPTVVTLPTDDQGIVAVLNALAKHVGERGTGTARVRFNGQCYTFEAPPAE